MQPKRPAARKVEPPFRHRPMGEDDGRKICEWRYPPPYDVFDWPEWERMKEAGDEFADPAIRRDQYRAVTDSRGELVGYAQFFPLAGVTRIRLGLRPDLCGRGLGVDFVRAIVDEARRRAPHNEIDLEVQSWNVRAQRVYERAGFVWTDTYERMTPAGPARVHCMVWKGNADRAK